MVSADQEGSVWWLNVGDGENRINPAWLETMSSVLDKFEAAPGPKVLVSIAEGKFFSNGLDLAWMEANPDGVESFIDRVEGLLGRIVGLGAPTVAVLQGHAFAAGAMFAMAHDYRLMRADRGFFCLPEVDIGMAFRPGMTALLSSKLSPTCARDAMITGRRYGGREAVEAGIVDKALEEEGLRQEALDLAEGLAGKAGETLQLIKRRMYRDAISALTVATGPKR